MLIWKSLQKWKSDILLWARAPHTCNHCYKHDESFASCRKTVLEKLAAQIFFHKSDPYLWWPTFRSLEAIATSPFVCYLKDIRACVSLAKFRQTKNFLSCVLFWNSQQFLFRPMHRVPGARLAKKNSQTLPTVLLLFSYTNCMQRSLGVSSYVSSCRREKWGTRMAM